MGSVKQHSKMIGLTAVAAVFLFTSISFDRAFAQDSTDPVVEGTKTTLTPPPQKRRLKLRKAVPAPEAASTDDTAAADASATQVAVPAPRTEEKPAAPVVRAARTSVPTTETETKPAVAQDEKPASKPLVKPVKKQADQPPVTKPTTDPAAIAATAKPEPVVKAAPPAIAKVEPTTAPATPLVNVPNLAAPVKPAPSTSTVATAAAVAAPAPLPPVRPSDRALAVPRTKSVDLSHGDGTGAADEEEREMYKSGRLKAADAEKIPESANDLYTVTAPRPVLDGANNKVIGNVKKGEKFTVVLPGENFARVRFGDGRVGFVDNSAIVPMEPVAPIQPAKVSKGTPPKPISVLPPTKPSDLEANCDTCDKARAEGPQAIDRKKTKPLSDIAKRLNRQNRLAGLSDSSREPTTNRHGIRSPSAEYVRRAKANAEKEAVRARRPSTWMRKVLGDRLVGGNRSKGSCFSAVKDWLVDMHLAKAHDHTLDNAYDAHKTGYLKKLGLTNILPDMKAKMGGSLQSLAKNAPAGAVLVYDQGRAGHIEVKAGENLFCSDFCSSHPVNTTLARRLIAVYVP